MMRFTPMTGVYSTSRTADRMADHNSVREGIKTLNGLVESAIVYFRPWMIEDGTMANVVRCANVNGIRIIPGMRPDLAAQGHFESKNPPPWSQVNWDEVSRMMKAAMNITKKRDFFVVMEPAFNPEKPPTEDEFVYAMRAMYKTGAHVIMDRPYIDHEHIFRDTPWLRLAHENLKSVWSLLNQRSMRIAPGISYSLLANPKINDKQRWDAEDTMRDIVGNDRFMRRYFVTANGRWPGDSTTDYMKVSSDNEMFDFLDAIEHHAEEGDQPPIAYIHIDQFVDVCQQIRKAVTNG